MISLHLRQILPPKMPFFVRQKVEMSSKNLPQIPNFDNFVKNSDYNTLRRRIGLNLIELRGGKIAY